MFVPHKIAAGIIALAALGLTSAAMARVDCAPHDRACLALHGPSTPAERARTRALNREALESAAPIPPAPPPRAAYRPAPRQMDRQVDRQYQREMQDYRQAQRRYEMETRRYRPAPRARLDAPERTECRALASARPQPWPLAASDEAWAEDHDVFAPTGGQVDPSIAAPTPGLDGAVTGSTEFNARANGATRYCAPPRHAGGKRYLFVTPPRRRLFWTRVMMGLQRMA